MNIININSKWDLSPYQITFIEDVLIGGNDKPNNHDSLYELSKSIPIYLVDANTYRNISGEERGLKLDGSNPATEMLGFYRQNGRYSSEEIFLCTDTILAHSNTDEELLYLLIKVLIHELAHALMTKHPSANYSGKDEFYYWMEEAMANLITLEHVRNFNDGHSRGFNTLPYLRKSTSVDIYKWTRTFIENQPANYRLGLDLHDHRCWWWWVWRNSKNEIMDKTMEKLRWLDFVKEFVGKFHPDSKQLTTLTESVLFNREV